MVQGRIKAHGGMLVNRHSDSNPAGLYSVTITDDLANDVENISDGIFSPLEGFLGRQDFENVVSRGRLENDLPWTIPIVFDVDRPTSSKIKESGDVLLRNPRGEAVAILHVEEIFPFNKKEAVHGVYGTTDPSHPGVARTMDMKDYLVGGKIDYIKRSADQASLAKMNKTMRMTPVQTRDAFAKAGWKTICAFQTRNPPHVAHEMLQKTSITTRDGVFVNPIVGKKKPGDFADDVIIKCYETMISLYYAKNRCILGTLHTEMKYAGPKEAIHHAIMRQNYGCTHIIIGRDHAGVGNFYDPFAAQHIFADYHDLEISPVFFPAFFYCKTCLTYTTHKACPHGDESKVQISGTKLREMIQNGQAPSKYILRPEVAKIILDHDQPFVC